MPVANTSQHTGPGETMMREGSDKYQEDSSVVEKHGKAKMFGLQAYS